MYCTSCGKELQGDWGTCPQCGTKIGDSKGAAATVSAQTQPKKSRGLLGCLGVGFGMLAVLTILGFFIHGDRVPSTTTSTQEWYQGGTLHKKAIADWRGASDRDRLATSADFMSVASKEHDRITISSMEDLRIEAEKLKTCIDTSAGKDTTVDAAQVSDIATACIALLYYGQK